MDLFILDSDLNPVVIVDSYISSIWTDRYDQYGDFELYMPMTENVLSYLKTDYYLQNRDSEHTMIIEKLLIKSDSEKGNNITASGRSLESILDRRIVWGRIVLDGNLQTEIHRLLNECIISPTDGDRKIANFIFEESTDPAITKLTIQAQYTGDNLYSLIQKVCSDNSIGFKIAINASKQFVFQLYSGADRSYDQTENPYVIFSPSFDNILTSNYLESRMALKNVALVAGEGQGAERKFTSVGSGSGLSRRELFVDASDISSNNGEGTTLTETEYNEQLAQRGKEKLSECTDATSLEGEAETTTMFRYGEHFFTGDIVQVADEYGHEGKARVIEMVMSDDENGPSTYPTFKSIEEGEQTQ